MYSIIKTYFDARIQAFNTTNSNVLVESTFPLSRTPLPHKQSNWQVMLTGFERQDTQAEQWDVEGYLETKFSMVNKDITRYSTIMGYVYGLARYLDHQRNKNSGTVHFGLTSISAEKLDNINEGSTELTTRINFVGEYYEQT